MVGFARLFKTAIELRTMRSGSARGGAAPAPLRPCGPAHRGRSDRYFEAVSRETDLPITLYLNPDRATISIPATSRSPNFRA